MRTLDDTALARRCAGGEEKAWRELVRRHGDLVFAVCYRVLQDRAEARDAAQEVLVRSVRSMSGFREGARLKPWLGKIAWNVALRKAALRASRPVLSEAPDEDEGLSTLPDPLQVAEQKEMKLRLADAISRLSEQERLVLELRCGQDMDYREIAEATGMPLGTVKTHLFRARRRVTEEMTREAKRDGLQRGKPIFAVS
jgi:RNA polymerase sigma-70 factor (ECF subfamily)